MAVTHIGTPTEASGSGDVDPGIPTGSTTGDLLLLDVSGTGYEGSHSGPTGWTEVDDAVCNTAVNAIHVRHSKWWAWYDAALDTEVPDTGNVTTAAISTFRGVDPLNPFDVTATTSTNDSSTDAVSCPSITTVTDGCMIVVSNGRGDNNAIDGSVWTNANLESVTHGYNVSTTSGGDSSMSGAYGILATAGASGATTATLLSNEHHANITVALRPAYIYVDDTSDGDTTDDTSLTVAHTVTTEDDRLLLVAVSTYLDGGAATPTATYNGDSMTQVGSPLDYGSSDHERLTLFQLIAPDTGTNNIVVSVSPSQEISMGAISLYGVDQSTPLGTASTLVRDNQTSSSIDISSETIDLVVDFIATYDGAATAGAGQTEEVANENGSGANSVWGSVEPGSSTTTMSWSWGASEYSGHVAVNVNAAVAGPVTVAVGQASETDSAQAISVVLPQTVELGQATETDSAQAVTPVLPQTVAVGQATETDTAQTVTPVIALVVAIGQATETDSAQAVSIILPQTVAVGQASETDSAQTITPATTIIVAVGQAAETDTAIEVTAVTLRPAYVSQTDETDTAFPITPQLALTVEIGQASETDRAIYVKVLNFAAVPVSEWGRWWRHTGDGRIRFVTGSMRGSTVGLSGWERVSPRCKYAPGDTVEDDTYGSVAALSGSDADTVYAAMSTVLSNAGYRVSA